MQGRYGFLSAADWPLLPVSYYFFPFALHVRRHENLIIKCMQSNLKIVGTVLKILYKVNQIKM